MEAIPGRDRVVTPEAMRVRVLGEAKRSFAGGIDDAELEHCVSEAVSGLWTDRTRVTSFIPVLALREVRAVLERRQAVAAHN